MIQCLWCGGMTFEENAMESICRKCWEDNQFKTKGSVMTPQQELKRIWKAYEALVECGRYSPTALDEFFVVMDELRNTVSLPQGGAV